MKRAALFALFAIALAVPVAALDGNQLWDLCKRSRSDCQVYIVGAADMVSHVDDTAPAGATHLVPTAPR